ncbi:MAG: twitch domain-containing radical SAM protein [Promethearchaeota archaeon]
MKNKKHKKLKKNNLIKHLERSKYFCMAPWISLYIDPTSKILPCCLCPINEESILGDIQKHKIKKIWNSKPLRKLRMNMLRDKPSKICDICYIFESNSIPSVRETMNYEFLKRYSYEVLNTRKNGGVKEINLKYIDIRFSNKCNYKCRTCNPQFSTSWYKDSIKLNYSNNHLNELKLPSQSKKLWKQINKIMHQVDKLYFAGGEPLIIDEHFLILENLININRTDVKLFYNTNLSTLNYKENKLLYLWNKFKNVSIGASLDGMEKRGELIRKGQNWKGIEKNISLLKKECPNIHFYISPTISIMNVLHLPDFHKFMIEKGYIKPNYIFMNILIEPEEFNIQILPKNLKDKIKEKYDFFINNYILTKNWSEEIKQDLITKYRGIVEFLFKKHNTELIPNFLELTNKLDKIRNENFFQIFPELHEIQQNSFGSD